MVDEKLIYVNPKQKLILNTDKKRRFFVGGRGSGKTTVIADFCLDCVELLPRSSGGLWAPTKEIIEESTLPEIVSRWESYGLIDGIDFVTQKRPPDFFLEPYRKPKKYDKTVSFSNGTVIHLIGLFTERAGRGLSLQWGAGDEMGFVKQQRYTQVLRPAIRGNRKKVVIIELDEPRPVPWGTVSEINGRFYWRYFFEDCSPYYMATLNVSSMPYLEFGKWILKAENDEKACFVESTAYDNLEVLGQEYINNLKEDLDPIEFEIEVMNKRIEQGPETFYPDWDDDKHVTTEDLYNRHQHLEISFDFGRFNGCTIWQEHGNIIAGIDELFVKSKTVIDLINKFIAKYKDHEKKHIEIFGDRNGNNFLPNSELTLYQEIEQKLRAAGWTVYNTVSGLDPAHAQKHLFLNKMLKEMPDEPLQLPRVRVHFRRCKNLIISIKKAKAKKDLKKDKSSEHPKSGVQAEHATHFSDTFDNYLFKKYNDLGGAGWML